MFKVEKSQVHTFLDDLISAFQSIGIDLQTSIDLSFKLLTFYGTQGASIYLVEGLATSENQSVMQASYIAFLTEVIERSQII